jgi:hypothetical protein
MHVSTGLLADPGRQECFAERGVVDDRKQLVLCSDVVMTQLAGDLTSSSQGLTHCRAALPGDVSAIWRRRPISVPFPNRAPARAVAATPPPSQMTAISTCTDAAAWSRSSASRSASLCTTVARGVRLGKGPTVSRCHLVANRVAVLVDYRQAVARGWQVRRCGGRPARRLLRLAEPLIADTPRSGSSSGEAGTRRCFRSSIDQSDSPGARPSSSSRPLELRGGEAPSYGCIGLRGPRRLCNTIVLLRN